MTQFKRAGTQKGLEKAMQKGLKEKLFSDKESFNSFIDQHYPKEKYPRLRSLIDKSGGVIDGFFSDKTKGKADLEGGSVVVGQPVIPNDPVGYDKSVLGAVHVEQKPLSPEEMKDLETTLNKTKLSDFASVKHALTEKGYHESVLKLVDQTFSKKLSKGQERLESHSIKDLNSMIEDLKERNLPTTVLEEVRQGKLDDLARRMAARDLNYLDAASQHASNVGLPKEMAAVIKDTMERKLEKMDLKELDALAKDENMGVELKDLLKGSINLKIRGLRMELTDMDLKDLETVRADFVKEGIASKIKVADAVISERIFNIKYDHKNDSTEDLETYLGHLNEAGGSRVEIDTINELLNTKQAELQKLNALKNLNDIISPFVKQGDVKTVADTLVATSVTLFKAIQPDEFDRASKAKSSHNEAPNMFNFWNYKEHLSATVRDHILSEPKVKDRAKVVGFWINVANESLQQGDLQTAMSIVSGMKGQVIDRLSFTKSQLSRSEQSLLKYESDLTSNNFKGLRTMMTGADNTIPFFDTVYADIDKYQAAEQKDDIKVMKETFARSQSAWVSLPKYHQSLGDTIDSWIPLDDSTTAFSRSSELEPKGARRKDIQ
ncbi:RasGEF domain-containing protein [Thermoproteota archaeon]